MLMALATVAASSGSEPIPGPTTTPVPAPSATPEPEGPAIQATDPPPTPSPTPPGCTVTGSPGDDRLSGTPGPDVMCGLEGDDVLAGLDGDDVIDGGDGNDTAAYDTALCCVRADLLAGTASGQGADRLSSIERLIGSQGDDVLRGTFGPNVLDGLGGTDLLYGQGGGDTLLGGFGDDYLVTGGGGVVDGSDGADVCADAPGLSCYPLSPPDGSDTAGKLDARVVQTTPGLGVSAWRVVVGRPVPVRLLWDSGYVAVSLDTAGDTRFEWHAILRSTGRKVRGLLLRDGSRGITGRVEAHRPGVRSLVLRVSLSRLGIPVERPYIRWAVRTVFTGPGCRVVCLDGVPAESEGAFPQPVV